MPDPVTPPEETPEQRLAKLEAENAALKAEKGVYDKTLAALSAREPAPSAPQGNPAGSEDAWRSSMKSKGYSDEQINANLGVLNDFGPQVLGPIANAMGILADRADAADFLSDLVLDEARRKEWDEVETERRSLLSRGVGKSRKDVYAAIVAKRAPKPSDVDKLVEAEIEKRMRAGAIQAVSSSATDRSTQHGGPGPAGGGVRVGDRAYTVEEFERLPLAEKLKAIPDDYRG